jgi:hypothetical protein
MTSIDDILNIASDREFELAALETFARQARKCAPYCEYLSLVGVDPVEVTTIEDIPFLPIELFKTHCIYCGVGDAEIVFTSSSTGGAGESKHYVAHREDYEKTFRRTFEMFYGDPAYMGIYALLPGYMEREGSSLIYMVDDLVHASTRGGFYLDDYDRLLHDMEADRGTKILFGVSYALLDLAETRAPELHNTVVMETGGMKGQREEIAKAEFHRILCEAFGVDTIHSEYGMAELSSQAYSLGHNLFRTPPWMRVSVRDLNDPFDTLVAGQNGGVNIIDLANQHSCAFIQTHDVGVVFRESVEVGSFSRLFSLHGRADRSEIRGCNLLIQ